MKTLQQIIENASTKSDFDSDLKDTVSAFFKEYGHITDYDTAIKKALSHVGDMNPYSKNDPNYKNFAVAAKKAIKEKLK